MTVATMVKRVQRLDRDMLEDLVQFERGVYGASGFNEWMLPVFARYGYLFVMRDNQDIIGTAELMRSWQDPDIAYLAGFGVARDRQGRGFGTEFMKEIIDILRAEHIKSVVLTVDPTNEPAMTLYRRHFGFRQTAFARDEYGAGRDRVILELDL